MRAGLSPPPRWRHRGVGLLGVVYYAGGDSIVGMRLSSSLSRALEEVPPASRKCCPYVRLELDGVPPASRSIVLHCLSRVVSGLAFHPPFIHPVLFAMPSPTSPSPTSF